MHVKLHVKMSLKPRVQGVKPALAKNMDYAPLRKLLEMSNLQPAALHQNFERATEMFRVQQ